MRGVGVVFSRFVGVDVNTGVLIGMVIVALYAVWGGMKGITDTQVAQYCVLIFAYLLPAIAIAIALTGLPIPQIAMGPVLSRLDGLGADLGLGTYSEPFSALSKANVFAITMALMVGTAGLPHVIVRFYTVRSVRAARWSAGWALLFIALLYTTAPAVAIFARYFMLNTLANQPIEAVQAIEWVRNWTATGLITLRDANGDGIMQAAELLGGAGLIASIDRDIVVLALPEIAKLAPIVIALVAAGGLAAALSTASGLLLVISSAVAHDLYGQIWRPEASDGERLRVARIAILVAEIIAAWFGNHPPGFVAQVVAFAIGLAAASNCPIHALGIFWKRTTSQGAIAGMVDGLLFTGGFILLNRSVQVCGTAEPLAGPFFGITAQGIGTIGMLLNFAITIGVSLLTPRPPERVIEMIDQMRAPA
jgi:cation/acetate symporter